MLERYLYRKAGHGIARAIRTERDGLMETNRNGDAYLRTLFGLNGTLQYIEEGVLPRRALDIGTGTGQGIHELSETVFSDNWEVHATGLLRKHIIPHLSPRVRFHLTAGEFLKGIPDGSISCTLALNSVAYSETPELVVENLDRVTVPGGAVKATFVSEWKKTSSSIWSTHHVFSRMMSRQGFGVAVIPNVHEGVDIMLAVKQQPDELAEALILSDFQCWKNDAAAAGLI